MAIPAGSYIVMQAYGSQDILNECAFALLSLTRQQTEDDLQNLTVIIYTDQPAFFKSFKDCPLNARLRDVNRALISQWRGAIDFVHRVKIEVLRDAVKNLDGQILYLDTDVCFAEPVTTIFDNIRKGKLYMHIMEGRLHGSDNLVFQKLSKFFNSSDVALHGKKITIPEDAMMWNAGVLGFHTKYSQLLDEVLAFTDVVYQQIPKHVVEQFAFSLYFRQTAPLLSAHTNINHYWNLKELRPVLASFFGHFGNKDWETLSYYSRLIQLPDYMQQKANFYYNRSSVDKLLKKRWTAALPDWDLLIHQL